MFEAVEHEAPRTKWVKKICLSIPASLKSLLNHLAMVLDVTALCGLIVAINSFVPFLEPRLYPLHMLAVSRLVTTSCCLGMTERIIRLCSSLVLTVLLRLQVYISHPLR